MSSQFINLPRCDVSDVMTRSLRTRPAGVSRVWKHSVTVMKFYTSSSQDWSSQTKSLYQAQFAWIN